MYYTITLTLSQVRTQAAMTLVVSVAVAAGERGESASVELASLLHTGHTGQQQVGKEAAAVALPLSLSPVARLAICRALLSNVSVATLVESESYNTVGNGGNGEAKEAAGGAAGEAAGEALLTGVILSTIIESCGESSVETRAYAFQSLEVRLYIGEKTGKRGRERGRGIERGIAREREREKACVL